jgi:hypothetical protein
MNQYSTTKKATQKSPKSITESGKWSHREIRLDRDPASVVLGVLYR